jgi:hypothetical protein
MSTVCARQIWITTLLKYQWFRHPHWNSGVNRLQLHNLNINLLNNPETPSINREFYTLLINIRTQIASISWVSTIRIKIYIVLIIYTYKIKISYTYRPNVWYLSTYGMMVVSLTIFVFNLFSSFYWKNFILAKVFIDNLKCEPLYDTSLSSKWHWQAECGF